MAILDGRDGKTLKEWLSKNKHVKAVTRDRASAYSAAIKEILPDAMQIADRFHLHQNLLEAIRNTISSVLLVDIRIPLRYFVTVFLLQCNTLEIWRLLYPAELYSFIAVYSCTLF